MSKEDNIKVPEFMKGHKELAGICVGGCVSTGKWSKGKRIKDAAGNFIKDRSDKYIRMPQEAAHSHMAGQHKGFICFRTLKDFNKETTCKHELAHIITGEGHTKAWAEKYIELGTPKWLTVKWLQKKYGFDNGNESISLIKDLLKRFGLI